MNMVKLMISDYFIQARVLNPETDIQEVKSVPYNVKQSIAGILFHPDLRLTMREALSRKSLADSIENCQEEFIYLHPGDFTKVKDAFNKVQGFGKNDIELLSRIDNASECDVEISEHKNGE